MINLENYIEINKKLWDQKTPVHVESGFYDVEGFLNGGNSLKEIERALLGDVKGKSILHLQCHFGLDTLSLSRMGAKATGVDFSEKAIEQARKLNSQAGLDAEFICCNIYDLPKHLNRHFDLVFTSYGTIGWLPDMQKWARIVSHFMKQGSKFIFVEFHPVVWMFDNGFKEIQHSYFNKEAIVETMHGTYADFDAPLEATEIGWNHSLSEVFSALLSEGLKIKDFQEYDYSPYPCFHEIEETVPGKYQVKHLKEKLPMAYSLVAEKAF